MNVSSINSLSDARRLMSAEMHASSPDASAAGAQDVNPSKDAKAARVAARQFEAIILRQLLSPAIEPLMSGGMTEGQSVGGGGGVYGYLVTDVLANSISQGRGLGLSKMLEKQLTPKGSVTPAQAASVYQAGKVTKNE